MKTFRWFPGELDRLQLSIGLDGTGDAACECCGRWISEHDPATEFCSASARRYNGKRRPVGVDLLLVIAEDRQRFAAQCRAYPRTPLHLSMYGWLLRLQPDPAALLRRNDLMVAPVRYERAA